VLPLSWLLIQDAPVMHYIAWRTGEGDVPYHSVALAAALVLLATQGLGA
jgi:hypothetical protein